MGGLVFDTISKQCGLPFKIGCEESNRLLLQEPQPIGNCPRQHGKWAVDETCNQYIDCTNGIERLVTCQNHLVFDDSTGDCEHPDAANRDGCTAEELYGFSCPLVSLSPGTLPSLIAGPFSHVLSTLTTTPDLVAVQSVLFTILIARFVMSQRMCLHVRIITRVSFI